jgi:hypothetical protein
VGERCQSGAVEDEQLIVERERDGSLAEEQDPAHDGSVVVMGEQLALVKVRVDG